MEWNNNNGVGVRPREEHYCCIQLGPPDSHYLEGSPTPGTGE